MSYRKLPIFFNESPHFQTDKATTSLVDKQSIRPQATFKRGLVTLEQCLVTFQQCLATFQQCLVTFQRYLATFQRRLGTFQ